MMIKRLRYQPCHPNSACPISPNTFQTSTQQQEKQWPKPPQTCPIDSTKWLFQYRIMLQCYKRIILWKKERTKKILEWVFHSFVSASRIWKEWWLLGSNVAMLIFYWLLGNYPGNQSDSCTSMCSYLIG